MVKTFWEKSLRFFTSARLTIFLFLVLALACIIGTVLPQAQPQKTYIKLFGSVGSKFINLFSLYDVYHAPWFQILLFLLAINFITCSLNRLPKTLRLLKHQMKKNIDKTFFTNLSFSKYFICHLPFERTKESLISLFKKEFPKLKLTTNPQFVLQGQKGNISHFGSYIIHGGILVILIGAIISSFFGFSGMMFIPEGGMSNKVFLEGRKYPKPYQLPFSLKCKEFIVDYYPNGMPKGYLSQMTIFDNKERFEKVIKVNGPLDYKGLRFYQATYGIAPEPTLHLEVSNRQSGESFKLSAPFNQLMSFPDGRGYVKVVRAFDDFMRMGPTFKLEILEGDKPAETFLLERFPQFDAMHRGGKYIITLKDYTRYTGLQVKKDPGTWVVWGGSFILVLGLMISFFIIPQKIWICLIPHEKGCEVYLGAISAKRKPLFKETFNNWVSKIEETLPCGT